MSAALIGAVCGSILSGRVTDSIGRKRTILITAVIFFLASILSALAPSVGAFIVGRIAIGVAIGVASYTAPLYIGEIVPPNLRGRLVTLNQLAITLGILLAYIIQQVTGINTVIYYAPTIFREPGFYSAMSSILATAGVGLVNMVMTVVSIPLIDKVGRRPAYVAAAGLARPVWIQICSSLALSLLRLSSGVRKAARHKPALRTTAVGPRSHLKVYRLAV